MDILEQLKDLRKKLEGEFKGFPSGCCLITSERVSKLGLEEKFGLFIDDNGIGNGHHWNEKDGKIYDLTANQFSNDLPEILILNKDSKEAERYVEGVCYFL